MAIPNINFRIDIDLDTDVFLAFMHHPRFPGNRNAILNVYSALAAQLKKAGSADEGTIVRSFVRQTYDDHKALLEQIASESRKNLRAYGGTILEQLVKLMEFNWPENHAEYVIVPTILPFSPFKEGIIFYSIAGKIKSRATQIHSENHELLPLFAHEVSHLILRDILKNRQTDEAVETYSWITMHFLQEIFAPVLMNQEPLRDLLGIKEYLGNPYLEHLHVSDGQTTENIVIHYKNAFERMRSEGKSFIEIVHAIACELQNIESALVERNRMWNTYGHAIMTDEKLGAEYKAPIKIK